MGRNRSKKKRSNNNANDVKRKVITVMLAIVIVGAVCLSAYTLATKKVVGKWEDKVYPGITIDNIDIGGMSKEEAKAKLEEHLKSEIANKSLHIKVKDQDFELIYSDINPQYDINDAVEQAFKFGKDHGVLEKYSIIKKGEVQQVPINFTYDEEKYLDEEFYRIQEKLKPKQRVIILEENLNIIKFDIKIRKNKISNFVDENIKKNIPQNGDVLYHYIYDSKSNLLYIYYIKGGKRIDNLIDYVKELEVTPIQFLIMSVLRNKFKIKDKEIPVLVKINNYYYYLNIENNIIKQSFIVTNEEEILKNIEINEEYSKLYIDNNILHEIAEIKNHINIISFDIVKGIYEKINKK